MNDNSQANSLICIRFILSKAESGRRFLYTCNTYDIQEHLKRSNEKEFMFFTLGNSAKEKESQTYE